MPEEKRTVKRPHSIILENRSKLNISGICDVGNFDDQSVTLTLEKEMLSIRGEGLRIGNFSVESGELTVEGKIFALAYSDSAVGKGGLFSRLFK